MPRHLSVFDESQYIYSTSFRPRSQHRNAALASQKGPLHAAGFTEQRRSSAVWAAIISLPASDYLFSEAKLRSEMSSKRKRADDIPENPLAGLPLTGLLLQVLACRSPSTSQNVLF